MKDSKILNITKDVQWIGVLDYDIRTFDIVMTTEHGSTYNSYFINAQKKTIIDTVKEKFSEVYFKKLLSVTDPEKIEYIIVNHTEPDHSGNLKNLLKLAPNAKVVGSGNAIRYMKDQIGYDFPHIIVKHGDKLDLGDRTLHFIGAPNLHWPDTIYTYLEEEKILFTCDSFGSHYCHAEMFDDKVGNYDNAFKYYFDVILKPYSKFVLKAIENIRLREIAAILPGHGPLLTTHWKKYVDLSEQYANEYLNRPATPRVFIPYVSAYQNTSKLALKIAEGVKSAGNIDVDICDIEKMPLPEIESKLMIASGIIIGTPTINQNTFIQIYQLFAVANPIRDIGKLAAAFGSYGWSGEGTKIVEACLSALKFNFIGSLDMKFSPHEKDYNAYITFGKNFGEQLLNKADKHT